MSFKKRSTIFFLIALISFGSPLLGQDTDLPGHFMTLSTSYPENCIYRGEDENQVVSLTFDDGPSEATSMILDLLDEYNVKATFFWQGSNLIKYPAIVNRAIKEGHELANHSWDHQNGNGMEPTNLWDDQIAPTFKIYDSLYNQKVQLYRPPFGVITKEQLGFLSKQSIKTVLWSISTLDWDVSSNSGIDIFQRFKSGLHPGAIVLLHDVDFNDSLTEKLHGIEKIIQHGKTEGYEFVTVTEQLNHL